MDEEKHTQYNTSHETIPVAVKAAPQESTNPFLVETSSKDAEAAAVKDEKRQSQVFYPPPMKISNDSNKYEVSDDDQERCYADDSGVKDAPLTPPDSAKNEIDSHGN